MARQFTQIALSSRTFLQLQQRPLPPGPAGPASRLPVGDSPWRCKTSRTI